MAFQKFRIKGTCLREGLLDGFYLRGLLDSWVLDGTFTKSISAFISTNLDRLTIQQIYFSELEREKRQIRLQILPIIQAEQDLEYVKAAERTRRLEAIATADDPTWDAGKSVYHTPAVPLNIILNERGEFASK